MDKAKLIFQLQIGLIPIVLIALAALFILFVIIYFLTIYPGKSRNTKDLKSWDYAHRGLHDQNLGIYENTMLAFEKAVENGFGAELDVQLTSDGYLVVFHDFDLKRMCGVEKKVIELTYEQISQIKIMGSDSKIPLLEDVLKIFEGKAPLIVEIKVAKKAADVCKKTNEVLANYKGKYCIESFNPKAVNWYRKNNPAVIRGQLSSNFLRENEDLNIFLKFAMTNLTFNIISKPDFVAYNHNHQDSWALKVYKKLYKKFSVGWTIRSQKEYDKAKKMFDIIIFEGFTPKHKL